MASVGALRSLRSLRRRLPWALSVKKLRSAVHLKFWFFQHYWWLLSLALIAAVSVLVARQEQVTTIATVIGGVFSLIYFMQKQKLEELRLFRELFKEFNMRYDSMNERLADIVTSQATDLSLAEQSTLIDYFNLCGEEYLYFCKGYIDPDVWRAWENGMKAVLLVPKVAALWQKEKKTGSYYGLPL